MDKKTIVFQVTEVIDEEWIAVEDGGMAKMYQFVPNDDKDEGMFVRLQSWDEYKDHVDFDKLIGKKVTVTVEVEDDNIQG